MSEAGGGVLTPELVLVSPELLAEAQQRQNKRKAAMSTEPANGTFFVDPAQPVPTPTTPDLAPPSAPAPEPVAAAAPAAPVAAAEGQSSLSAPMIDVPLGTLIFRAGLLAEEQLEDALQEGMRTGKRLGEVLIERGWLNERDLGRLLAGQKGLPFVEISASDVEPGALQTLPEEKAKLQVALPLRHEDGQLVVAVADPSNELMLENLRRALGAEPRLVVAPYADLVRAIGEAYENPPVQAPPPAEPVVAQPEQAVEPVAAQPETAEAPAPPEPLQPEVQLQPQPEAPLTPPVQQEPVADPIPPLTPPVVTPLPTVLPPAEERAGEPVPSPLVAPPPVQAPPAAAEPAPPVEVSITPEPAQVEPAPLAPPVETLPPLHQQVAPEPVAPQAPAPVEPQAPVVQPPPASEPVLQPPVAPPPAAEVTATPAPPVEAPEWFTPSSVVSATERRSRSGPSRPRLKPRHEPSSWSPRSRPPRREGPGRSSRSAIYALTRSSPST